MLMMMLPMMMLDNCYDATAAVDAHDAAADDQDAC